MEPDAGAEIVTYLLAMSDDVVRVRLKGSRPARPVVTSNQRGGRAELPLDGVVLDGAAFEGVDFSRQQLRELGIHGCTFIGCDFRTAELRGSIGMAPRPVFRECAFDGADLRHADPGEARFERCTFDGARLDGWRTWNAEFVECRFGGRLHDVEFDGRSPTLRVLAPGAEPVPAPPNEFRGNDFRAAELDQVDFRGGIDLDAQLWPDDPLLRRVDVSPDRIARAEAAARRLGGDRLERDLQLVEWLRNRYREQPMAVVRGPHPATFDRYLDLLGD